jgi:hypothetical protein
MALGMSPIHKKGGPTTQLSAINSALVNVKNKSGKYIYAGRKLTGFSNEEEEAVGKTKYVPFKLEDRVRNVLPLDRGLINASNYACSCSWLSWGRTSAAPLGARSLLSMKTSSPVRTPPVRRQLERPSSKPFRNSFDKPPRPVKLILFCVE